MKGQTTVCRQAVTVSAIYRDDVEVNAAKGGENLRLRLTGIEEEEMQAGFVICSRHVPVPCVTYFQAQLQVCILLLMHIAQVVNVRHLDIGNHRHSGHFVCF